MASNLLHSEQIETEHYHYRVSRIRSEQFTRLNPEDTFIFTALIFHSTDTNSISETPRLLRYRSRRIRSQYFFQQEGQDFLRTQLSIPHFFIVSMDEITDGVVSAVRELFVFGGVASHHQPSESQHREIPLWLTISVFENGLRAVMEESMLDFRMIPASEEAVKTLLKKSKVVKQNECCSICLEQFDVNAEGYTMPCSHFFHQHCIVSWLQTSHVCPLCRHPLPTINN